MRIKIFSSIIVLAVVIGVVSNAQIVKAEKIVSFSDVPESYWAYDAVKYAFEHGYIAGIGDGKFDPEGNVTYGQFLTMLGQAYHPIRTNKVRQSLPNAAWYVAGCVSGEEEALLNNTDYISMDLSANTQVTRLNMVAIIYNLFCGFNKDFLEAEEVFDLIEMLQIPDIYSYSIPLWPSIVFSYDKGILSGMDSNGTFSGNNFMTRAQATVVMLQIDRVLSEVHDEA